MTKQEIEKKIKELQEKLDNKDYECEIWIPAVDDIYYHTYDNREDASKIENCNDVMDKHYFETGNYFKTKEKAEFEYQREKYTRLFRKYVEENSESCDWNDGDKPKYFLYYDESNKTIQLYRTYIKYTFQILASNEQVLWDALKFVGEDNFKKYILEIEE